MQNPRLACALAALLLLAPGAGAAFTYPVRISSSARYLVDQDGVPVPILGRTAWFITSLSVADYKTFLDDTAAKGHTAIEFHVLNHDPRGNNQPYDGNGDLPFTKTLGGAAWSGALTYGNINTDAPDFTQPNEPYWAFVDALLAYCESKGLFVFMFPAYVGYAGGDQGWMQEMVANGSARMQAYGAFIANRYKNQKNIVWMMGGDMGSYTAAQQAVEGALIAGLKGVANQQSTHFAAEWNSGSICTDQGNFGSNCTLNSTYSWEGDVSNFTRRAYARTPPMPAFLLEEPYDQEGSDGNSVNGNATQPVRRFQWWGFLAGIAGYMSGNGYVWPFNSGWQTHLNTQGAQDMMRLNAFIGSIAWWNLVPSGLNGMKTLITAGGSTVSAADYVGAAAAADKSLLVAYVPPAHSGSITVDMTAMGGTVRARWFNPATAAYTLISASLPNTGTQAFTSPGNNGTGYADWALVLDVAGGAVDGGVDAGTDAGTDAGADAGTDAGADAGADGGLPGADSGPGTGSTTQVACGCSGSPLDGSWLTLLLVPGALRGRRRLRR